MADAELAQKLARMQNRIDQVSLPESTAAPNGNQNENDSDVPLAMSTNGNEEEASLSTSASDELKNRLARRQDINEGREVEPQPQYFGGRTVYNEFTEFTRKQIKQFQETFKKYDENRDGFLDFEELKRMMEKLGEPQTHLSLKGMIREVDEDADGMINLREFLLIFRKAAAGELAQDSGLGLLASLACVDVSKEGVGGAKSFFEAKIDLISKGSAFEEEIKREQEEKRRELEEKRVRREKFLANQAIFH